MSKQSVLDLIARATMGVSKLPPATEDELLVTESSLGRPIPNQLRDFLSSISNGLKFGGLRILPAQSKCNVKKTADSIARNNEMSNTNWFYDDPLTFAEFLVFGVEESHTCYCFKKNSAFVWVWSTDSDKVEELDYEFWPWLYEAMMQEGNLLRFRP